jgi:DNA-binding GntR family transcriptional regulator
VGDRVRYSVSTKRDASVGLASAAGDKSQGGRGNALVHAYDCIKESIVNMAVSPGQKLHAQELAARLNVSRTPIREALGRLEQEGLVRRDSGWGYVVRPMNLKEILDLFALREVLEPLAATEAAARITKDEIRALKAILDQSSVALRSHDNVTFRVLSRRFHMTIAGIAQNELLYQTLARINDRTRLVATMQLEIRRGRGQEILAENRSILRALERGSAAPLRIAILSHVRRGRQAILDTQTARSAPRRR